MQSDTEYFRMRIEQERQAAAQARDSRVRLRHLELAAAYVFRVREIEALQRQSAMRSRPTSSFGDLVSPIARQALETTTAA